MHTFAFVFARGGSKGLPGKNIKPLAGKPLIAYSIELAQSMPEIDRVFVSTDDNDIKAVAREYGAEIIDRPDALATDTAAELLSWKHAVEWVQTQYGEFSRFISLPATAPLREVDDVRRALSKLSLTGADICVSMMEAHSNPYFSMVRQLDNGFIEVAIKSDTPVCRRQDAPTFYDMTSVVYATSPEYVLSTSAVMAGDTAAIIVPRERAVDIDDAFDFAVAEALVSNAQLEAGAEFETTLSTHRLKSEKR